MMDRPFRSSTDAPQRPPTAILATVLAAACVVSSGCITGPDGRPLGAGSFDAVVDGLDDRYASEGGQFEPLALDDYAAGACGSTCDDGECPSACDDRQGLSRRRRFYEPEAGIFNFCVPPATIGPPAPPPPGRFHPVPTRPVFSPRPSLALAVPLGG